MRTSFLAIILLAAGLSAALPAWDRVPTAHACSCPDCDAFRDSPVVVRGTVLNWDYVRDASGQPLESTVLQPSWPDPKRQPRQRPIRLLVEVDAVYRGEVYARIAVSDYHYDRFIRAEGAPVSPEWLWPGEAGVCFGLQSDPTGVDAVMALVPGETPGTFRLVIAPFRFDDGTGRPFAERFPSLIAPRPPAAGNSLAVGPAGSPATVASPVPYFVILAGGFLLLSFVLILIGPRNDHRR
jgi:hypothetical protein